MPKSEIEHSPLVREIVDILLARFERLPMADRNLVAIASIEAVAWLAAMETTSHIKKNNLAHEEAMERFEEYTCLFETIGKREIEQEETIG